MNKFEQYKLLKEELLGTISEIVNTKKCICCDKEISLLMPETKSTHPLKQEQSMWENGIVNKISGGYGSDYDLCEFYFGICDECITSKIKSGHLEDLRDIKKDLRNMGYEGGML
jgi:hypothetical protein